MQYACFKREKCAARFSFVHVRFSQNTIERESECHVQDFYTEVGAILVVLGLSLSLFLGMQKFLRSF